MTPRNPSGRRGGNGGDMALPGPPRTSSSRSGSLPRERRLARLAPAISALRARSPAPPTPIRWTRWPRSRGGGALAPAGAARPRRARALHGAGDSHSPASPRSWQPRPSPEPPRPPTARRLAIRCTGSTGRRGVGIGNGGAIERIRGGHQVADEGEVDAALHHAADALTAEGDAASGNALVAAARCARRPTAAAVSADVRARVTNAPSGWVRGHPGVRLRARGRRLRARAWTTRPGGCGSRRRARGDPRTPRPPPETRGTRASRTPGKSGTRAGPIMQGRSTTPYGTSE